jgi:hypothetical protein
MTGIGTGRKIFYFFPEGIFHQRLVEAAIVAEYEIYTLSKGREGIRLITGYPNSLVFIHEDTALTEEFSALEQEARRQQTMLHQQQIEIFLLNPHTKHHSPAQFDRIALSETPAKAVSAFLTFLEESGAKGQRRYVRFGTNSQSISPLRITSGGNIYTGTISDISAAGVSFVLEEGRLLPAGARIDSFTMEIGEAIEGLKGTITLRRKLPDGTILLVAMFDSPDHATNMQLHRYIHASLQRQLLKRLKSM